MFTLTRSNCERRAGHALMMTCLAMLLSACAHSPPDDPQPRRWNIENAASKPTAELTAAVLGAGVFQRSGSRVINDYTVESGNLIMPDRSTGSLVTVRSKDGSLTAVVEEPGNNGLLTINKEGEARFVPFPRQDYSLPDTIIDEAQEKLDAEVSAESGPFVIDMLIGYSRSAVDAVGGNAYANALAQVESVNLALRNSRVDNVSMELVGVQVIDRNYPITGETVGNLQNILAEGMRDFRPDLLYGVFSGDPDDTAVGWAHGSGRAAIGYAYGEAFRHEVGHNAGGNHCYEFGGRYKHGFNNGKTSTAQCGNESPYYSTPAVKDQHGLAIGDSVQADMARVWRENAKRMAQYTPIENPEAPKNFRATPISSTAITFAWDAVTRAVRYQVWRGIVLVEETRSTEVTTTNVTVGLQRYHVVAVYSDGTVSPPSNVVWTKPL